MMKTVIMAGGKGTRISSMFADIPKPMIKVAGRPVLEHQVECLRSQGFTDIIITVSHLAESITDYFGDGERFGVSIEYFVEREPLGNAGALFTLRDKLSDSFLLINGDVMFDVDLKRFAEYHRRKGGLASLFTHPNNHPYDAVLIEADEDNAVTKWLTKEDPRPQWYSNRVNAGLHILDASVLDMTAQDLTTSSPTLLLNKAKGANIPPLLHKEGGLGGEVIINTPKVDLDRQVLRPLCGTGRMFCYDSPEYVRDMGTPDRYNEVCRDFTSGKIQARSLRNKQRAVFLDRDGTINQYVGFLRDLHEFELLPGVAEAVKIINASGYLAIVATNQPVIARGEVSVSELEEIHRKMETLLGQDGAYLDAIYYCPHHPHSGYNGEVPELKIDCDCRKPKPGMLLTAARELNIDLSASWMVGDGESDILAGKSAGCRTALIGTGDFGQDMTVSSLLDFTHKGGFIH